MRKSEQAVAWVVYQMTVHGKPGGLSAVCEQGEWEEMELARPGYHTLIRAGISNEAEAESLARERSGFVVPVHSLLKGRRAGKS